MKLVSAREDWDRVAALLSADWFVPFWHIIQLPADTLARAKICEGSKAIVRKLIGKAATYIGVDFSEHRLQTTREELFKLVDINVGMPIIELLSFSEEDDNTTIWLLDALTLQAIEDDLSSKSAAAGLPSETRAAIRLAYSQTETDNQSYQLEAASQASNTPWDRQLREWSPGQPTWLTDWLFARSFDGTSFKIFWSALTGLLTKAEAAHVREWYASQARSLADPAATIALPRWMN